MFRISVKKIGKKEGTIFFLLLSLGWDNKFEITTFEITKLVNAKFEIRRLVITKLVIGEFEFTKLK